MIGHLKHAIFKNYATFRGRAGRPEYWTFTAFWWVGYVLCNGASESLGAVWILVFFLPGTAVAVRRLHDIGKSGFNLLWLLVPCVGFLVLLAYALRESEGATPNSPPPSTPSTRTTPTQARQVDLNELRRRLRP